MNVRALCQELQEKAQKELNEDPSKTAKHIQDLRNWLEDQPHLKSRTDDQFLLTWLRACHFDLESARQKIDLFYTMRSFLKSTYTDRDPFSPEIQEVLNSGAVLPLLTTEATDSPRIILMRYEPIAQEISIDAILKAALMIVDIVMLEDDNSTIGGQHGILDVSDIDMDYLARQLWEHPKNVGTCLQLAYPTKPAKLDIINCPPSVEFLFYQFRNSIPADFVNMVTIYNRKALNKIFDTVPKRLVPTDYGGEGKSVEALKAHWKKKVESYKDWFLDDEQYGVDESKRPGGHKTEEELFAREDDVFLSEHEKVIRSIIG